MSLDGQYVHRELISDFVKLGITWFSPQELSAYEI